MNFYRISNVMDTTKLINQYGIFKRLLIYFYSRQTERENWMEERDLKREWF